MRLILAVILAICSPLCKAGSLDWAGEVGNSGGSGEAWSVVRGAIGRSGGGVVVGREGRVFAGGGDRILALTRDGKLLWSTALPQSDWVLSGPSFAIAGKYLYFQAGRPLPRSGYMNLLWTPWTEVEPNLCRVEMYPGAKAQVVATFDKVGWSSPWFTGQIPIATDPTDGNLYIGGFSKSGFDIFRLQPNGTLLDLYRAPQGGRFSIDEYGRWYYGGAGVMQADKSGKQIPGTAVFPIPSLGSVASQYMGVVMMTRDNLWDMGIYGFVGRFTKDYKPDPGVVSQWNQTLYFVAQIADAPDGAYYIESVGGLFLAKVIDGQVILMRRFGSLTTPKALCLLPDGYIGVGDDQTNFHWYDYSNPDPAAAPVRSEYPGPSSQGYVNGSSFAAYQIGDYNAPDDYTPASSSLALSSFRAEPFVQGANTAAHIAYGSYPVTQITAVTQVGDFVYALDTKLNLLLRAQVAAPCNLTPIMVPLPSQAVMESISGQGSDRLLIGTDIGIAVSGVDKNGTLSHASIFPLPDMLGGLGKHVYVASDGDLIVASDTDRHRVVVLKPAKVAAPVKLVAQFGTTDTPGADNASLDAPTLIACSGGRIIVYDSGNQRIVKLLLRQ